MSSLETIRSIVQLSASGAVAATILSHLATRKTLRRAETVRRLVQICGKGAKRGDVIAVLRQLEAAGFGRVILGRHRHESRFEWAVNNA